MSSKSKTTAETEPTPEELNALLGVAPAPLSFASAVEAAKQDGGLMDVSGLLGTDAQVVEKDDKARLVGVPFLILEYTFNASDVGDEGWFVSIDAITQQNEHLIINDGSRAGIYGQCRKLEEAGVVRNIPVRKGLRRSDFYFDPNTKQVVKPTDEEGWARRKPASSYFLNP